MSRTLFVGDVHGCAAELQALLALTGPSRLILVGDLFTKGPDPRGVWQIVCATGAEAVLGNHDDHVLRRWTPGESLPSAAFDWLRERPLWLEGPGWRCVHAGVVPEGGPQATPRELLLNMRRYPDGDERSTNPFWWELVRGPPLTLYGHDARRGLVDRRPHTLGLDSGCVYGGRLSGYLLEEDQLYSVPAERVWRAPKGMD